MRETKFIDQNKEKWSEFESMLRDKQKDPDKLNELFVQITDDLSYARTYYPNRSVRLYLNSLAQKIFHNIYRGKRFRKERLVEFWTEDLPRVLWESRLALLLSFSVFVLAFGIGVVSSILNPDFARVVLGDSYVDMTLENIQNGDPMAVYKESRPLGMSVGIAANNLFVALRTAVFGVAASIGTLFMLLYNGIMVGAFQYFFIERGLFWQSFLTIWIHGTLEISAIIIAGGAGLVAGSGLLFPGTYTRARAFQLSMRKGIKIFIGLIPVFLMAAFFEGFVTRYTDSPAILRAAIILLSLAFVLWYFVWYPWHKARQAGGAEYAPAELLPDRNDPIQFAAIKNSGELFSDVFTLLSRHRQTAWISIVGTAFLFTFLSVGIAPNGAEPTFNFSSGWLGSLKGIQSFFTGGNLWYAYPLEVLLLSTMVFAAFQALDRERGANSIPLGSQVFRLLLLVLPVWLFVQVLSIEQGGLVWLLGIFAFPFLSVWAAVIYFETPNPLAALMRSFRIVQLGQIVVIGFLAVNLGILMLFFLDSGIFRMISGFLEWLVPPGEDHMIRYMRIFDTFMASVTLHFLFVFMMCSGAFQYFSGREISDANGLRKDLENLGKSAQIRGLARE